MVNPIGEIDYCRRWERSYFGEKKSYEIINTNLLNNLNDQNSLRAALVDAFFASCFSDAAICDKDYKITSAIADVILEPNELDGIAYPSVAHRGGLNFAIKPAAFKAKMRVKSCSLVEITDDLGYGIYGRKLVKHTEKINSNGGIFWDN